MRVSGGPARRLARAWWPETITVALLAAIACAGQANDPLFSVVEAIVLAAGWAMGRRHRLTPVHAKLDRIGAVVGEVRAAVLAEDVQDGQDELAERRARRVVP